MDTGWVHCSVDSNENGIWLSEYTKKRIEIHLSVSKGA